MFVVKNVLSDGPKRVPGLGGAILCETTWVDHHQVTVTIRTFARVTNKSQFPLALRATVDGEYRIPLSPSTAQLRRAEPPVLIVDANSSIWLPAKFLQGAFMSVRPLLEDEESSPQHARRRYHFSQTVHVDCFARRHEPTSSRHVIVCFPCGTCATSAIDANSKTAISLAVISGPETLSKGNTIFEISLGPVLRFMNYLPLPVRVQPRSKGAIAPMEHSSSAYARSAAPASAGPLCLIVITNNTSFCLHGRTLATSDPHFHTERSVVALSTSTWSNEFKMQDDSSMTSKSAWKFTADQLFEWDVAFSASLSRKSKDQFLLQSGDHIASKVSMMHDALKPSVFHDVYFDATHNVVRLSVTVQMTKPAIAVMPPKIVRPGESIALYSWHPSQSNALAVSLDTDDPGTGASISIRWRDFVNFKQTRTQDSEVDRQFVELTFQEEPHTDLGADRSDHQSPGAARKVTFNLSQNVLFSQELVESYQHSFLWCSVWLLNATKLPMSFEDPSSGCLAVPLPNDLATPNTRRDHSKLSLLEEPPQHATGHSWSGLWKSAEQSVGVDAIKIALRSKTQWTQSLKIDTPGTIHDFFLDDVYAVGDRLQLSLNVSMIPYTTTCRDVQTRLVTVMPYASVVNFLNAGDASRHNVVVFAQHIAKNETRSRQAQVRFDISMPGSASPLVWTDRHAGRAIKVVRGSDMLNKMIFGR